MLQETLLPAGDPVDLENGRFEGYAFIGKPRTTPVRADKEVRGGGLAVLVRQDLTGFETAFDAGLDRVTEYLQVEVSWQGQTFKLLNIYRPPCEQTRDKTSTDRVTAMAPESWPRDLDVVGGDLNLRHPAWDATCGVPSRIRVDHRPPSDCMRELAEDVLEETVGRRLLLMADPDVPTHPGSGHVLDVLFASGDYSRRQGHVLTQTYGSDHRPVLVEFNDVCRGRRGGKSNHRRWQHANWGVFRRTMEKASAAALRKEMDLHRALKLFHNALNLAIREAVPTARRFTCKARRAMRIKCKKRQQLAKLKEELDELASDVDEEEVEKKAEQLAELGRFCGELPACDSKAAELVFARIRDVFGKDDRGQMAALRKPGGCDERPLFAETAVTKAEVLADIYAEVGEGTTAAAEEPSVGEELLETDAEISVAEVREALRAQPDGKAAGLDGVNCEPLKHLGDNGVLLLHRIFCLVYENGEWPRGWAMACIVPILKMGKDPSLGGSYRPVSLTSVLAKLCERVIGGRLKHVTQRCISDSQAGFRRGRGTAEHLAACQLRLAAHTARGRFSAMLCADLSRAFDRVDHNLLLGRLGDLGVRGRLWRVLRAFLHKRMARVRVDGEFSETRAMKAGVPQGTILAPMLFVLFVDDLARRMDALDLELHFLAYADDVAFPVSADSRSALEERVAKGLAAIEEWAEELRLMLSREKTVVLARNPSGDAVELDVDFRAAAETAPEKLRCVDSLRYLGLVFKAKANPLADFLEEATARSYARLTTLRVLAASQWASTQLLRTVYLGYVLGTSRYGIALADASGLTELKAMHRKALRLVTGCHPSTPDAMLCAEAAIPPIEDIVREEAAKLRELLLRLPGNAPGRRACLSDHRAPTGWLSEAEKLAVRLRLDEFPREELQTLVPFAPWEQPSPTVIHTVPGCDRAREGELEVEAAARRLRSFFEAHEPPRLPKADLTICTDGSVQKSGVPPTTINGRSGVVWQIDGDDVVRSSSAAAGAYASSFSAEYRAMEIGLRQLVNCDTLPDGPVHLLSDSQSALKAVQRGPCRQTCAAGTAVWKHLHQLNKRGCSKVTLHFVPAHAGHPGNEAADKEAAYPKTEEGKRADAEEQQRVPLPLASARAAIRAHHRGKRMDALATVRDPRKKSTKLRQEVYWRLTAGAAARPQHRKLHRLGEKLWHQLRTGYGPLGYVFGSQGSPRPIPYGYKCPACGAEDMSLLHVLAWCSHTETAEEAAKLGLRFVLRDASKTVEQRAKAARWMTRVYPARVLRLLCRSGWIDTCENLLIRPGAADPMSPGEVACLESEAIARADAEVLEEATRGALAAQLCRGVLAVRDRERAAGVRRRVAVLPSPPETRNTLRRSAGPSQQETRAEFEKRRDALRESNMAATAVLQRRLDEKRAWLRKRSKELVEARGVGADRVEIEWEQGVYDLYVEYKAEMPCESTQDFYPE